MFGRRNSNDAGAGKAPPPPPPTPEQIARGRLVLPEPSLDAGDEGDADSPQVQAASAELEAVAGLSYKEALDLLQVVKHRPVVGRAARIAHDELLAAIRQRIYVVQQLPQISFTGEFPVSFLTQRTSLFDEAEARKQQLAMLHPEVVFR